jgi:hypothetical protein
MEEGIKLMMAYSLAKLLKETFGLRTYVKERHEDTDQLVIQVLETLQPPRLRAVQEFAEDQGWEIGTRYDPGGHTVELTEIERKE